MNISPESLDLLEKLIGDQNAVVVLTDYLNKMIADIKELRAENERLQKMLYDPAIETYQQALDLFGYEVQAIVAIEELAELQQELSKFIRGKYRSDLLAEEMADVEIMLAQMSLVFRNRAKVEEWKQHKLERLKKLIENHHAIKGVMVDE